MPTLNIPQLNVKLSGADETLNTLNCLYEKLTEANALANELAQKIVKIDFGLSGDASTEEQDQQ